MGNNRKPEVFAPKKSERYQHALKNLPVPGGGGCHGAILGAANYGVLAGNSAEQIFKDIRRAIPNGRRIVPDSEIRKQVEEATRSSSSRFRPISRNATTCQNQTLNRSKHELTKKLIGLGDGISEQNLAAHSPIKPSGDPAQQLLDTLYTPEEFLYLGEPYGKSCRKVADWKNIITKCGTAHLPLICSNPLTGKPGIKKDGKPSLRCDDAVKSFRFAVAEFDERPAGLLTDKERRTVHRWAQSGKLPEKRPGCLNMPIEQQLAFWAAIPLPVAALIYSGGKSIHAWIRVDLQNLTAWEEKIHIALYGEYLTPMGLDRMCRNPSRLMRMPGHVRDNGQLQRLLYLNPEPEAQPIAPGISPLFSNPLACEKQPPRTQQSTGSLDWSERHTKALGTITSLLATACENDELTWEKTYSLTEVATFITRHPLWTEKGRGLCADWEVNAILNLWHKRAGQQFDHPSGRYRFIMVDASQPGTLVSNLSIAIRKLA
jgi:hypothetical protein